MIDLGDGNHADGAPSNHIRFGGISSSTLNLFAGLSACNLKEGPGISPSRGLLEYSPLEDFVDEVDRRFKSTYDVINKLQGEVSQLNQENQRIKKELDQMKNIVKPDERDVHNINRRIELLAQRIAKLESKPKKKWWEAKG